MDARAITELTARARALAERAELPEVRERLDSLSERLAGQRVYVAVLGQFKRGKSTLINALVGEQILPSSVVPLTAIPTVLRHGPARAVEVRFLDDRPPETLAVDSAERLLATVASYVTEKANPKNVLNVAQVEIIHPAAVLEGGLALVDTPGIGSTLTHNTQATINFLPECDAAPFVLSCDPPLTQVEREFLDAVRSRVSRLYFVLTKVDNVTAQELDELLGFLSEELVGDAGGPESIIPVSARRALGASRAELETGDPGGIGVLRRRLAEFSRTELATVLVRSFAQRLGETLAEMESRIGLERSLLTTPVEELEHRAALPREVGGHGHRTTDRPRPHRRRQAQVARGAGERGAHVPI